MKYKHVITVVPADKQYLTVQHQNSKTANPHASGVTLTLWTLMLVQEIYIMLLQT